jgi:hypothetical protein
VVDGGKGVENDGGDDSSDGGFGGNDAGGAANDWAEARGVRVPSGTRMHERTRGGAKKKGRQSFCLHFILE